MEKTIRDLSKSRLVEGILLYTAILATIAVAIGAYNQHTLCDAQKSAVTRNVALDNVIDQQIKLYKDVGSIQTPVVQDKLAPSINKSIDILTDSQDIIQENTPTTVQCIVP